MKDWNRTLLEGLVANSLKDKYSIGFKRVATRLRVAFLHFHIFFQICCAVTVSFLLVGKTYLKAVGWTRLYFHKMITLG